MPAIRVNTPAAVYNVTIGHDLLRTLYPRLRRLTPGKTPKMFVVTSPEIWALWRERFLASFPAEQQPAALFLPAGESHKRMASVEALAQQLAMAGADRDSILLAFGGGVIGDVTGFLAAIYMRGIRYVGLPSTMLAQVDSSLGGKTGVNLVAGKNLIGSFHHPLAVFLGYRPIADITNCGASRGTTGGDQGQGLFGIRFCSGTWKKDAATILGEGKKGPDPFALLKVVNASVKVKADVVAADEKESGLRMILNFGHTLGHAIEAATNYRKLLHGRSSIAWGMIAALHVSVGRGKDARRHSLTG